MVQQKDEATCQQVGDTDPDEQKYGGGDRGRNIYDNGCNCRANRTRIPLYCHERLENEVKKKPAPSGFNFTSNFVPQQSREQDIRVFRCSFLTPICVSGKNERLVVSSLQHAVACLATFYKL